MQHNLNVNVMTREQIVEVFFNEYFTPVLEKFNEDFKDNFVLILGSLSNEEKTKKIYHTFVIFDKKESDENKRKIFKMESVK